MDTIHSARTFVYFNQILTISGVTNFVEFFTVSHAATSAAESGEGKEWQEGKKLDDSQKTEWIDCKIDLLEMLGTLPKFVPRFHHTKFHSTFRPRTLSVLARTEVEVSQKDALHRDGIANLAATWAQPAALLTTGEFGQREDGGHRC